MALWGQRRRGKRRIGSGLALFLLPLPLLLKAVVSLWTGDFGALFAAGAGYAAFAAAGLLMMRGARNEQAYIERPFATGRPVPLKSLAAVLAGLATAFTAFAAVGHGPAIAACFGIAAACGAFLYYGRDPGPRVLATGGGDIDAEVAGILSGAYQHLDRLDAAGREIASAEFKQRLGSIVGSVDGILKLIERNPREVRRARKFLNIYLGGAQRITDQYTRAHGQEPTPELEHNFRTLLVDMENTCYEQHKKLLQNDVLDLDVQIEVLSARLRQEGVP